MKYVEYSKKVEVYGEYDVVVLGGGPAGVCASVSAARRGMKVLLVESTPRLGGMATTGMVGPFMTTYDRDGNERTVGGIYLEILERLKKYDAVITPDITDSPSIHTSFLRKYHRHVTPFESFQLEIVLDEMVREAGVEVLCYTQFVDCITDNGAIVGVTLNALEGMIYAGAKIFIDCTGIAAVAQKAGVPTYKGDEENGIPQPATLMFEVGNVDDERYVARPKSPVKAYKTPSAGRYRVNHYHVYNVDAANSKNMTEAHAEARHQVLDAYGVLRNETAGFENAVLMSAAPMLGVRECRHIEGEYKITVRDVAEGTKFEDRIGVYGFGMDIHNRTTAESGNFKIEVAERYYIAYRSLIPKNCSNLLVAGKTLSCESQAVGGMRCMPAAMAMGQAAGIASAMAVSENVNVRDINVPALQSELRALGAIID